MSRILDSKKLLIVGAEGTGKRDVSKCIVENKIKEALDLDVLTCSGLPLPGDRDLQQTGIQFICFVVHTASRESLNVLTDSLSRVDVSYFCGRSAIVANTKDSPLYKGVEPTEIQAIAEKYSVPVYYANTQVDAEIADLGLKLMCMLKTAIGWTRHVSPLLYETMRIPVAPLDTSQQLPQSNTNNVSANLTL